eukprot:6343688-Amphidinium_carterae.1
MCKRASIDATHCHDCLCEAHVHKQSCPANEFSSYGLDNRKLRFAHNQRTFTSKEEVVNLVPELHSRQAVPR